MRLIVVVVVLVELLIHWMLLVGVGHSMSRMVHADMATVVHVIATLVVGNTW